MRIIQHVLFTAIAVLGLAVDAQAATIVVGNYDLLPNTPGQKIPLYVSGIVPNAGPHFPHFPGNVAGLVLDIAINDGGPEWGSGPLGPTITSIDVVSGPTIWEPPNTTHGHNAPATFYAGQIADINFAILDGWVNVTGGLLATVEINTTGFASGTFQLTLTGGVLLDVLGGTEFIGNPATVTNIIYQYYNGTAGQITIVPEPSSVALAAIGLIGAAAWGWRRRR